VAGSSTFGPMSGVVVLVVGDIRKLATEPIQFGLSLHTAGQSPKRDHMTLVEHRTRKQFMQLP